MNKIFKSKSKLLRIIHLSCILLLVGIVRVVGSDYLPADIPDNNGVMFQQGITVTGTVADATGETLPGVAVMVKGTATGQATNIDGQFTINVPGRDAILVFSYIGFRTLEMQVGDRRTINVVLQEDANMLDEVVVVGFGAMERKYITSAISSVSNEQLMQGVGGSDISAAIQGKIGGLVMFNLGSANASTSLQLRGQTSMNAGSDPLIVVDGFPGGDLRSLNMNDIQSIEVLKDASAAAIYGTRASAGVLLITTKSGTETQGQAKLTYNNEFLIKQNYNAPKMLSGREYAAKGIGTDWGNDTDWMKEITNQGNFSQKHDLALNMGTRVSHPLLVSLNRQ